MPYLLILAGFILLVFGGDTLVRGAVSIARRLGWSELLIGLTLVSIGTSAPELFTNIEGALSGAPGIAVGNVIGSNIANILMVLGATAIIYPVACAPRALRRDGAALICASFLLIAFAAYGQLPRMAGIVFLCLLAAYLFYLYKKENQTHDASALLHEQEASSVTSFRFPIWVDALITCVGIGMTMQGAKWLVSGATDIARQFGVSDTVIGLTVVAIGTSLPELVTSVMAARKRCTDVALGNVVGSNIVNILLVLGGTAIISPLAIDPVVMVLDVWVLLFSALLLILFARTDHHINRREGLVFVACYVAYIGYQLT